MSDITLTEISRSLLSAEHKAILTVRLNHTTFLIILIS